MRKHRDAVAAKWRARTDLDLSPHPVTAGRVQLPAPAYLLGVCRRSHCALRFMGRRMDDIGAAVALSAMGHIRGRQCPRDKPAGCTVVSAVAVRKMAGRQWSLTTSGETILHRF